MLTFLKKNAGFIASLAVIIPLAFLIYDYTGSSFLAFFFFLATIGLYDHIRFVRSRRT